jgi:hypothetical protein
VFAFECERLRNKVSSLTVKLEDAEALAESGVRSASGGGGAAAAPGSSASLGGAAGGGAGSAVGVDGGELGDLRSRLEAATMEVRALERQLVEARQREERARVGTTDLVKATPEYRHLALVLNERTEQFNKERAALKAHVSRVLAQAMSERAELAELRRVGDERRKEVEKLVAEVCCPLFYFSPALLCVLLFFSCRCESQPSSPSDSLRLVNVHAALYTAHSSHSLIHTRHVHTRHHHHDHDRHLRRRRHHHHQHPPPSGSV